MKAATDMNYTILIQPAGCQETIEFAAAELHRYLCLMAGEDRAAALLPAAKEAAKQTVRVGLFSDFGWPDEVDDPRWDDAVRIDVRESAGIVAGVNPRSVLFAVYRFLEVCGCRWIRPGKDGDWVPAQPIGNLSVSLREAPGIRHRGHSHCGGPREAIMDKIRWMAKVGLNSFYQEYFPPISKARYYARHYPSLLEPRRPGQAEVEAFDREMMREVKRRGLLHHAVGHGWTAAFFGLYAVESEEDKQAFYERASRELHYIAEVNGERRIHRKGGGLYTELCYGNPEVRERLVRCVADYAAAHPEIDVVHFNFSDSPNRMCECPLCRDTQPSDWMVILLNGIDEELTRRKLDTRIGFSLYQENWWAPKKERVKNPSRFIMKFAPIGRDYREPYALEVNENKLPPFRLNRNDRLGDMDQVMASLSQWRKALPTDTITFEYHLTWHHYFDPGYYGMTRVLAEDIRRLPALGLSGMIGCQVIRCYFPTSFPVYLNAKCLWNPERGNKELADEYFRGAFGEDGPLCRAYMQSLSEHFSPGHFYNYDETRESGNAGAIARLKKIPSILEEFQPVVEKNLQGGDAAHLASWRLVQWHMPFARLLAGALRAFLEGNQGAQDAYADQLLDFILINEIRLGPVLDNRWFVQSMTRKGVPLFGPHFISSGGFETRSPWKLCGPTARDG